MAYESLFKPIKIGTVEIKNRIGLAPQNLNFSAGGYFTEQHIYYKEEVENFCKTFFKSKATQSPSNHALMNSILDPSKLKD